MGPLFSTIVTLYLLILLYLPYSFIRLFLPPILISTSILLYILRLGTSQLVKPEPPNRIITEPISKPELEPEPEPERETEVEVKILERINQEVWPEPDSKIDPSLFCKEKFVGWDVGAPLEVIYEAYEGEEEEEKDEHQNDAFQRKCTGRLESYPSLSRYYPESESESESDSACSWEGEFREMELIEIALDYYGDQKKKKKIVEEVPVEEEQEDYDITTTSKVSMSFKDEDYDDEDNLIEIDISPNRNDSEFCWRD